MRYLNARFTFTVTFTALNAKLDWCWHSFDWLVDSIDSNNYCKKYRSLEVEGSQSLIRLCIIPNYLL